MPECITRASKREELPPSKDCQIKLLRRSSAGGLGGQLSQDSVCCVNIGSDLQNQTSAAELQLRDKCVPEAHWPGGSATNFRLPR